MKKALLLLFTTLSMNAIAQCPNGETQVTMTVTLDRYGTETTWSITGPGGSPTYASGGPYTDAASNGAYPQTPVTFCVPDGSTIYVTVNDSYGDGMCCAYGDGGWAVSVGGTTVSSGGSFATVENASVTLGTDLGINALSIPTVIAQGSTTVNGTVKNNGIVAVNGYTLEYVVDGGSPVSQNFTGSIAPGATGNFSFTTQWNATVGSHTIALALSGVSGDAVAANNTLNGNISVATQSVQRTTLVEEFTSSTCGPCASFNSTFDPTLASVNTNMPGSNIAAIKYQMNWPSPGNDPSYNPDGATRRTYYGVTGIPDAYLDGAPLMSGSAAELTNSATKPAFANIGLTVTRSGMEVTVEATVTTFADFGTGYKLHIAAVENEYAYAASTTSQDEFHFAQRKMMPNGSGTTLSALTSGGTQTVTESYTFVETPTGNPTQNSYALWEKLNDVIIVAFVQNTSTKEILQAGFQAVPAGPDGINDLTDNVAGLVMYPNPTNDVTTLRFDLKNSDRGSVNVFNMQGALVYSTDLGSMAAGANTITLGTDALSNGLYVVNINLESGRVSRRLTVSK